MSGGLVLVGTPIGNLGDLSPRAREALESADVVACEDTRRTGRLYQLSGMTPPRLVVLNDHTETTVTGYIVSLIEEGCTVAVVTDAGMPGIADPGERVARAVIAAGLPVTVVPGPSAALASLVLSGLPAGRFVFEGFLPRKGEARARRLGELATDRRTVVLFESPHRLGVTLGDLVTAFGADRPVAVAREITKLHEQVWRGSAADAADWATATPPRGEVCIVVGGAPEPGPPSDDDLDRAIREELASGSSTRDAAARVAARFGASRREVYGRALDLSRSAPTPDVSDL